MTTKVATFGHPPYTEGVENKYVRVKTNGTELEYASIPDIKSGSVMTDASGEATVTFNTAFADANYAIHLTAVSGTDTVICMYNTKAAGSFNIKTEDDGGKDEGDITVDWIAVEYSDV
jgi:hypothetical protein